MPKTSHGMQVLDYESIEGWSELDAKIRSSVETHTASAKKQLSIIRDSRLGVGKDLFEIRKLLLPHKMWISFLRIAFGWSERTAYRWITEYEQTSKDVPPMVLQIAIERNSQAITKPEIRKKYPLPKTENPREIADYLDKIDHVHAPRPILVQEPDVDQRLKGCLNFVGNHFSKIKAKREKQYFIDNLLGMELTKFGIASAMRIGPLAIPDDFQVLRGRPKKVA